MTPASPSQIPDRYAPVDVPVRLYSALRTIRIYPPANPQVARTCEQFYRAAVSFLQAEKELTLACTDQALLVNGVHLGAREQERPQVVGLVELFHGLQIHALTFRQGFSPEQCRAFLTCFSALNPGDDGADILKNRLEEAGVNTVSVDAKRYVALHEGEQVVLEGTDGIPFSLSDLARFLGQGMLGGDSSQAGKRQEVVSGGTPTPNPVRALLSRIEEAASPAERNGLVDRSAALLTGLDPRLLVRLLETMAAEKAATELVERTVRRLDDAQLEALLIKALDKEKYGEGLLEVLNETSAAPQVRETADRVRSALSLLDLGERATPQDLLVQLRRPEWSAPVLATALRQLVDSGHDFQVSQERMGRLLSRYERDLPAPEGEQVAESAAGRLAHLQERELGRILMRDFQGGFGSRLYEAVVNRLSDDKFEQVARELNFLAQGVQEGTETRIPVRQGRDAYQRFMQTVRGRQLQRMIDAQQSAASGGPGMDSERILEGMRKLLAGDYGVLAESGFVPIIAKSLQRMLERGKGKAADQLLLRLVGGLRQDEEPVARASAQALGLCVPVLVGREQWSTLEKLVPALSQGLVLMDDRSAVVAALEGLTRLVEHYLQEGRYDRASGVLRPLFELTLRPPDGQEELARIARNHLDTLAVPGLLEPILTEVLRQEETADQCRYILTHLGAGAAHFLMVRLRDSESRPEREMLIDLIAEIGKPARDALLEHLDGEMEWYVVRNIVRLLRDVGDPDCFSTIAPLIEHDDLRVRREVIETLGVIGGPARKRFFLDELERAPEELKPLIIKQLGGVHDESVVLPLAELLERTAGQPFAEKEPLQAEIVKALVRLHSKKCLPVLKRILKTREVPGLEDFSPRVLDLVEQAVHSISDEDMPTTDSQAPGMTPGRKNDPLAQKEAEIFRKAAQGEKERAKKELYELVVQCAQAKDFANAERLRERIYEIDPMALTEIIRSGEIIEKEKTGAIGRDKLETWSELLELLTPVEFSAIYHEMEQRRYAPEEIIVRQGDRSDELLFVDQGSVKVTYLQGDREIFVSTLNSGQIYGENFFSPSLWTVTLTALTAARISALKRKSFQRWHEEYPGLENKLLTFHDRCNTIGRDLQKKGLERRRFERYEVARKIQVQMLDQNRRPVGRAFRGEMVDISQGGLAFLVRISKRENARLLLGRIMRITVPVAGDDEHQIMEGMAISVHPFHLLESDFAVHIRFLKVIGQHLLQQVLG